MAAVLAAAGWAGASGCGLGAPRDPPAAYDRYCARCHGDDGRGDPKAVALNDRLDLVAAEMVRAGDLPAIERRIARGRGAMPGFSRKLSEEEIAALARHTLERFGPAAAPAGTASPGNEPAEPPPSE